MSPTPLPYRDDDDVFIEVMAIRYHGTVALLEGLDATGRRTTALADSRMTREVSDELARGHRPIARVPLWATDLAILSAPPADELSHAVSLDEAARMLGMSRTAFRRAVGLGRVRTIRVGRRRFVPAAVVEAMTR